MDANTDRIGVVPVGAVHEMAPKVVAAHISGYLSLQAESLAPVQLPLHTFNGNRLQYDAGLLLREIESIPFDEHGKIIAIVDVDLFLPIFTHVFGEARQGGKAALVSLYRLGKHGSGLRFESALVFERAAKIALHELGHLYDLLHCDNARCLMHFSGGLDELDRTSFSYCRYCATCMRACLKTRGLKRK